MEQQNISSAEHTLSTSQPRSETSFTQRIRRGVRRLGVENLGLYLVFIAIFVFLSFATYNKTEQLFSARAPNNFMLPLICQL